jgi:hypothetical protein
MQAPWLLGDIISGETATKPGKIRFNANGYDYYMSKRNAKNIKVLTTFTDGGKRYFGREYIYDSNAESYTAPTSEADTGTHFEPLASDRQVARLGNPAYTAGEQAVQFCDSWVLSQSHAIIAMATGAKALLAIVREERDTLNQPFQYADPTSERLQSTRTLAEGAATSYLENGQEKATGWAYAPSYSGSALGAESGAAYDGKIHIRLGAADSGLLRKGLEYELVYALYDASTGTETNVCTPIRIKTGSDDNVAFSIYRPEKAGGVSTQRLGIDLQVPVQKVPSEKANYLQYRFYYRPLGSQEWLPGGFYWAVDLLFNGKNDTLWLARAAIGASIGGAPGQFNDYSPLPQDDWKDVAVFQSRFFWASSRQAIFSLRNNALAYPLRNAISLPSGEFRGITVHCFYGQSQQTGRVVFWASDAQYEGRFTENYALYPVSVSPDYRAQFPLDGSDFVVQFRSTFTAFSSRAAVVAEGALFFWGESGIYADSGVQPPNKISAELEPWLDGVYDPAQISKIHCFYNESPKEITWFYPPRVNSGFLTEAIVFNAEKNSFQRVGFGVTIDWSQNLNLTQEGARKRLTCGKRIAIGHSFAFYPQRMCFHDLANQCGDLRHGREFLVKEIQAIAGGSRLILASGFDIPAFADVAVGEAFLINQSFEYTESENEYNGRYTITDIGNYYFDIAESLTAATFTTDRLLPIWLDMYSAIPFKLRTRYIMPTSHWQLVQVTDVNVYLRLINKEVFQDFTMGVFSNVSLSTQSQTFTLERNANEHCIRRLTFPHFEDSTHGTGYGLELSGAVNGAQWRLDWLGIEGTNGEDLGRFEQQ